MRGREPFQLGDDALELALESRDLSGRLFQFLGERAYPQARALELALERALLCFDSPPRRRARRGLGFLARLGGGLGAPRLLRPLPALRRVGFRPREGDDLRGRATCARA